MLQPMLILIPILLHAGVPCGLAPTETSWRPKITEAHVERIFYDAFQGDEKLAREAAAKGKQRAPDAASKALGVIRVIEYRGARFLEFSDLCGLRKYVAENRRPEDFIALPDQKRSCTGKLAVFVLERAPGRVVAITAPEQGKLQGKDYSARCMNGKRDGPWTIFHANGQKRSQGEYRQGLKHGAWKFWDAEGRPLGTLDFENDQQLAECEGERCAELERILGED